MLGGRATATDDAAIHTLPFQLGLGEVVLQGHFNPLLNFSGISNILWRKMCNFHLLSKCPPKQSTEGK